MLDTDRREDEFNPKMVWYTGKQIQRGQAEARTKKTGNTSHNQKTLRTLGKSLNKLRQNGTGRWERQTS